MNVADSLASSDEMSGTAPIKMRPTNLRERAEDAETIDRGHPLVLRHPYAPPRGVWGWPSDVACDDDDR
jgi:hypothetical protein